MSQFEQNSKEEIKVQEWIELVKEALALGITVEEIQEYLKSQAN